MSGKGRGLKSYPAEAGKTGSILEQRSPAPANEIP